MRRVIAWILERLFVAVGASALTALCFLVLPVLQAITKEEPEREREVDTVQAVLPEVEEPEPEPPPPEPEPPEPEPEPEPVDDLPLLELAQLEMAMDGALGGGMLVGDFSLDLGSLLDPVGEGDGEPFDGVLDQPARPKLRVDPDIDSRIRRAGGGTVVLICVVNERGEVEEARVESSDNPVFNEAALEALQRWRWEPATSGGKPVRSGQRVPFTFE